MHQFNCAPGLKVTRGKDWKWGHDDFDEDGRPGIGHVTDCLENKMARVQWVGGKRANYRMWNQFDLCIVGGKESFYMFSDKSIKSYEFEVQHNLIITLLNN